MNRDAAAALLASWMIFGDLRDGGTGAPPETPASDACAPVYSY